MVVIMDYGASEAQIEVVINSLNGFGFDVHRSSGVSQNRARRHRREAGI